MNRGRVTSLLETSERKRELNFWKIVLKQHAKAKSRAPAFPEPPEDAVRLGKMPAYLRGSFVIVHELSQKGHAKEARMFHEAISDLMQEHFKRAIDKCSAKGSPIAEFRIAKGWNVYGIPHKHHR